MIHVRSFPTAVDSQIDEQIADFLNSLTVPHEDTLFLGVNRVVAVARESEDVATAQAQLTAATLLAAQTAAAAVVQATAVLDAAAKQELAVLEAANIARFGGSPLRSRVPPLPSFVDGAGNIWTLVGGVVKRNGATAGAGQGITASQILWIYGHVYALKVSDSHWYLWDEDAQPKWTDVGTSEPWVV